MFHSTDSVLYTEIMRIYMLHAVLLTRLQFRMLNTNERLSLQWRQIQQWVRRSLNLFVFCFYKFDIEYSNASSVGVCESSWTKVIFQFGESALCKYCIQCQNNWLYVKLKNQNCFSIIIRERCLVRWLEYFRFYFCVFKMSVAGRKRKAYENLTYDDHTWHMNKKVKQSEYYDCAE